MERILVTGGTGFVAGWCIVELLKQGYQVRTTVRSAAKSSAVHAAIAPQVDAKNLLEFAVADLTRDDGWDAAMAGCTHVLHVASPLGTQTNDPAELIESARGGTLRVLRAARRAGVKRVVMTSAAAAARVKRGDEWISDESAWAEADIQPDPYRKSKILAEKAAWEDMALDPGQMSLTTILPVAVFGPVLTADNLGSVQVIQRLLNGKPPAIPRLGFSIVDVRDLAAVHVKALLAPAAANQRFVAAGEFMWLKDVATLLKTELGEAGHKVPTRAMPDWVFRTMALFVPLVRMLAADLGRRYAPSALKARTVLGFKPRPVRETLMDCARSLTPGNLNGGLAVGLSPLRPGQTQKEST